jgi:hypothetical protein
MLRSYFSFSIFCFLITNVVVVVVVMMKKTILVAQAILNSEYLSERAQDKLVARLTAELHE